MKAGDSIIFRGRKAVVVSAVRAFLHAAAAGAVLPAAVGAGRPASFVVGGVLGIVAASRSRRVGVVMEDGRVLVANYFRTVLFPELSKVRLHQYARNRIELEGPDGSRTLVQAATYWTERQRSRFLEVAGQEGIQGIA